MPWGILKVVIAGSVISFSSWLAGQRPALAGFVMALPISSLIAPIFTQAQYQDAAKSAAFARSIFYSMPLPWTISDGSADPRVLGFAP